MEEIVIDSREIRILSEMDVLMARKAAVQLARSMGFRDIAQAEIEIVISELGTNIVKHARSQGMLWVMPHVVGSSTGLKIIVRNTLPTRQQDQHQEKVSLTGNGGSTVGTLGIGISGVRRLMDEFDVANDPEGRLTVTTIKWLRRTTQMANCSVICRPKLGEMVSGDGYYIHHLPEGFVFGVIDGLGHGQEAKHASDIAIQTIDLNHQKPLNIIIGQCHAALEYTRGVAMSLGFLDYRHGRFFHAGIGNIETRIYIGDRMEKLMTYNGTLGVVLPHFTVTENPFGHGMLIVMYSDGISDKFELDAIVRRQAPQEITQHIMDGFGRSHDDATVLVVK